MEEENFSKWTVKDLKEYLLQYDIITKDIKGSGKNGNVLKQDLIYTAKTIGKQHVITNHNKAEIPDDVVVELVKHMKTYDRLEFCSTDKHIHTLCQTVPGDNIQVILYNLQYKKMIIYRQLIFIINNGVLYSNNSDNRGYGEPSLTMRKVNLPNGITPLALAQDKGTIVLLTSDGLYAKGKPAASILMGKDDVNDFIKIKQPPGDVLYMSYRTYLTVITTKGLYYIGIKITSFKKIDIDNPLMVVIGFNIMILTKSNLYIKPAIDSHPGVNVDVESNKYADSLNFNNLTIANIDGINDILSISTNVILTSTGVYSTHHLERRYEHIDHTTIKSIDSDGSYVTWLDKNNILHRQHVRSWQNNIYPTENINLSDNKDVTEFIIADEKCLFKSDNNYYYEATTSYQGTVVRQNKLRFI